MVTLNISINPKKIKNHVTNFIVYIVETYNDKNIKATPFCITLYSLTKLAGKNNHDLSPYEYENCKKR